MGRGVPVPGQRDRLRPLFEVANHSYSHHAFKADCYGLPVLGEKDMAADVERAFRAFRKAGVRQVVPYFRFPAAVTTGRRYGRWHRPA